MRRCRLPAVDEKRDGVTVETLLDKMRAGDREGLIPSTLDRSRMHAYIRSHDATARKRYPQRNCREDLQAHRSRSGESGNRDYVYADDVEPAREAILALAINRESLDNQ